MAMLQGMSESLHVHEVSLDLILLVRTGDKNNEFEGMHRSNAVG